MSPKPPRACRITVEVQVRVRVSGFGVQGKFTKKLEKILQGHMGYSLNS